MEFDDSFFADVEFLPYSPSVSRQGAPNVSYEGKAGTPLKAAVFADSITRQAADGRVVSETIVNFWLQKDPSWLNGGKGIQTDDVIRHGGRLYRVEGLDNEAQVTGLLPVWQVRAKLFA